MQNISLNHDNIIDFIADIFQRRGADSYLGEAVTMSEHMLQAAQLAEAENADASLIAAALLHDIGHYTNEFPEDALEKGMNNYHDMAGAKILAPFFPEVVQDCVRYHVDAKRYLCATQADYFGKLSSASIHTLSLQGGPMNAEEVILFEQQPHVTAIIRVRQWDEGAKIAGMQTPDFEYYIPVLQQVLI